MARAAGALLAASAVVSIALSCASRAWADEPVAVSEPRLLKETSEVTSVVDAFDDDEADPFDLHLTLGFEQRFKRADVRRETSLSQGGLSSGGFVSGAENVAAYRENTSLLHLGAQIGVWRDLALILHLPVILSNTRELESLDGSAGNPGRLQDPGGQQIFGLPFKSPNRSGIDWFSIGANYAITNQQRDVTKPSWVVGVEGRIGVGTPLHACNANPGTGLPECPDPVDPTNAARSREPGISRGMNSIVAHTTISRRFGYVEPYTGFWFLADFARSNTDFGSTGALRGALVNHAPMLGRYTIGLEVIPWERREKFQRLVLDGHVAGTYHSAGREYSELFDALGSTQSGALRTPNPAAYRLGPDGASSVADPTSNKVFFSGITQQSAYGSFTAGGGVTWQMGEYFKLQAGGNFTIAQSHLITGSDACNPNYTGDAAAAGFCQGASAGGRQQVTGIPNPLHREVIDLPGRRFTVDNTTLVNLWLNGVVMF